MRFVSAGILSLALLACTAQPVQLTSEEAAVRVYRDKAPCEHDNLGVIAAQPGNVSWDKEGNEAATISMLKKQAAALGANAMILTKSEFGDRQWHSSGVVHHGAADAIRCKD